MNGPVVYVLLQLQLPSALCTTIFLSVSCICNNFSNNYNQPAVDFSQNFLQNVCFIHEFYIEQILTYTKSTLQKPNIMYHSFRCDSAVITSRLVFNSSSPAPSESLVLSAIRTLLSSRLTDISDTKVLNITYQSMFSFLNELQFFFRIITKLKAFNLLHRKNRHLLCDQLYIQPQ